MKNRIALCLLALSASFTALNADIIHTQDGSELKGTITKIADGVLFLDTSYAGVLEIQQSEVAGIETESDVSVRLNNGNKVKGTITTTDEGLIVKADQVSVAATVDSIHSGWSDLEEDPVEVAQRKAAEAATRKWTFKVGLNVGGKSGNTDKSDTEINASAKLKGPNDTLKIYTLITKGESDGEKTDNEIIAGVSYNTKFSDKFGWYVRTEGEKDDFEDIDFRSTNAAGLSYLFCDSEKFTLDSRLGLAYRYESYFDDSSEEFPGIDVGLDLEWQMTQWATLNSEITYLPSFDDFGSYILKQDTGVEMPIGLSERWMLRLGISNDYNSEPEEGKDELDTTYYARLILTWK
jgi:putative salt-induced outer membrane protein YdiY